jgi:phage-related protein
MMAKTFIDVQVLIQLKHMAVPRNKPIDWIGSSFKDLCDDEIFPEDARRAAGYQLRKVQRGDDPDDWNPFDDVGAGTKEIRIKQSDGAFRVMYVAKFEDAIYVLHCFKKKTQKTSQKDKDLSTQRYKDMMLIRSKK